MNTIKVTQKVRDDQIQIRLTQPHTNSLGGGAGGEKHIFFFFFWTRSESMWDLSSPTRDQTLALCNGNTDS